MTLCPARANCAHREAVSGFCSKPRNSWCSKTKSTSRKRFFGVVRTGKVCPSSSTAGACSTIVARQTLRSASSSVIVPPAFPLPSRLPSLASQSAEQEVPRRVHRRVDNRGGKDGARSAPRPAVENSGNGGQRDVAPVGKSQIGDVGKPEENRSRPPADNFAFGRPR